MRTKQAFVGGHVRFFPSTSHNVGGCNPPSSAQIIVWNRLTVRDVFHTETDKILNFAIEGMRGAEIKHVLATR